MAIYHYAAQMIQRSKGQSAVAAAAYRAGVVLRDERLGITHDYSRKRAIAAAAIMAPPDAPTWVYDRAQLWNQVEAAEKQCNSQVAREINVALPHELTLDQCQELLRDFVQAQFVDRGMIADVVIHDLPHNRHAHLMLTTRPLEGDGFGLKNRDWNQKALLDIHREAWADHTNRALANAGCPDRIDHRRLQDQGVEDRLPQIHLGANVMAMKVKAEEQGEEFDHPRWERYQAIEQFNAQMRQLQQEIAAEIAREMVHQNERLRDRSLANTVNQRHEELLLPEPLLSELLPAAPISQSHQPDATDEQRRAGQNGLNALVKLDDVEEDEAVNRNDESPLSPLPVPPLPGSPPWEQAQQILTISYAVLQDITQKQPGLLVQRSGGRRYEGSRYWLEWDVDTQQLMVGKQGESEPFVEGQWQSQAQQWEVAQAVIAPEDWRQFQAMQQQAESRSQQSNQGGR